MSKFFIVLFSACLSLGIAQPRKLTPALQSLVEAERSFARMGAAQGVRASFLAYFAPDGLMFQPGPVNAHETLQRRPVSTLPLPLTLNWAPVWGAIAASGDLGMSTGPSLITDNTPQQRPPSHGVFFSIWKKQPDGAWKVIVDIGISTPTAVAPLDASYQLIGNPQVKPAKTVTDEAALLSIEREFLRELRKDGAVNAYLRRTLADTRLHRPDTLPAVGPVEIGKLLAARPAVTDFEVLQSGLARSGDFGWTLSKYSAVNETGYFVRAWQRDSLGVWRLLAEVANPLPAVTPQAK